MKLIFDGVSKGLRSNRSKTDDREYQSLQFIDDHGGDLVVECGSYDMKSANVPISKEVHVELTITSYAIGFVQHLRLTGLPVIKLAH